MTDREDGIDVWKTWSDSGELKRSAIVWAERDDFCAWEGMEIFPEVLEETAKEVLRESASFEGLNGRAWIVKLLNKLQEPPMSSKALEKGIGKEPSNHGASYEEWFAYDRFKGAENYEDWWKAGGREGIAETEGPSRLEHARCRFEKVLASLPLDPGASRR